MSLSAFGTPTNLVTKPGLTNTDFIPVTGWTRTTGWIVSIGSRRGILEKLVREEA